VAPGAGRRAHQLVHTHCCVAIMGKTGCLASASTPVLVQKANLPSPLQAFRQSTFVSAPQASLEAWALPSAVPPWVSASAQPPSAIDLLPWMDAASAFEMNLDFDVVGALGGVPCNLDALMSAMKTGSVGKMTIQALGDKNMLHRLMANLGVPQMPAPLIVDGTAVDQRKIEQFVLTHLCGPSASDVAIKPSHLSNSSGVMFVAPLKPHEVGHAIQAIVTQMRRFTQERADAQESAALRSLRPGFIAQSKYDAVAGFESPLELRVVALWGKARVAVWWWGREAHEHPERSVWFVRRPIEKGKLRNEDFWEPIDRNPLPTPSFNKAVELFNRDISAIAATAEAIAVAVGAPFLRSDFFVGSEQWGVRLNEVAYGSGIDYLNRAGDGSGRIVDDAPIIAQILQEGFARCRTRLPPQHFLGKLGAKGTTYADLTVSPLPPHLRPVLPMHVAQSGNNVPAIESKCQHVTRTVPAPLATQQLLPKANVKQITRYMTPISAHRRAETPVHSLHADGSVTHFPPFSFMPPFSYGSSSMQIKF